MSASQQGHAGRSEVNNYDFYLNTTPNANAHGDFYYGIIGNIGEELTFNGQGIDPNGKIVSYMWDFENDGIYDWSSTTNGVTRYSYEQPGIYTAKLKVEDNDGNEDIDIIEVDTFIYHLRYIIFIAGNLISYYHFINLIKIFMGVYNQLILSIFSLKNRTFANGLQYLNKYNYLLSHILLAKYNNYWTFP